MALHRHIYKLPSHFYSLVGRVIVEWNLTEALISSIIWKIHRIRDVRRGRTLIYALRPQDKLKISARSAQHFTKSPTKEKELMDLQRRASACNAQRNLLAHGLWGHMPNASLWKVFNMQEMDDSLLMKRREVRTGDLVLEDIVQGIELLNTDFRKFMARNRIPPP
jgi:hypothetical protein